MIRGVISHVSALVFWGMSDVSPAKMHITVGEKYRLRRTPPDTLVIHRADLQDNDITWEHGISVTIPVKILLGWRIHVPHAMFEDMRLDFSPPTTSLRPTPEEIAERDRKREQHRDQEQLLVAQLRAGDAQALASLMAQYANSLARFAFYIVDSVDVAEDIVQRVFIQLWTHRDTLAPDSHLRAYLFRLTRNQALNERSASAVRARYRMGEGGQAAEWDDATTLESPEDNILTDLMVQDALEQLPERRRQAVRLRLKEAMTHAEIAEVLGVSIVAAQHLVARAISDLRKILGSKKK
jgi:RNA polymerase sigma-70 factor (ECF subfamily)